MYMRSTTRGGRTRFVAKAAGVLALGVLLAGCETTTTQVVSKPAPEAVKQVRSAPTPPEYTPCNRMPEILAQADAIVREYGQYSETPEGSFWVKRQERLIARAYECR